MFGTFEATAAVVAIGVGNGAACLNRTFGLTAFAHVVFEQFKNSKWKMS